MRVRADPPTTDLASRSRRGWRLGAALLVVAAAGCRTAAVTPPPPSPPAPPTAAPTPTATPTPWVLVGPGVADEVRLEVEEAAAASNLPVRVDAPGDGGQAPPPGLVAVVAREADLLGVHSAWSEAGIAFVIIEPSSLGAGERTSLIGPRRLEAQAGFLAGVAAALATSFGGVGLASGDGSAAADEFAAAFGVGVRYACPRCRQGVDIDPARTPFGTDVVGLPPGAVVPETLPPGAPWLVVGGDSALGPWEGQVVARVGSFDPALIGAALASLLSGMAGEAWVYTVENGGLRVVEVDPRAISPGRERLLREAETRLAAGLLAIDGGN